MIPSKNKKLLSLACIALLAWAIPVAQGQFPEIANSIFGPDSYFRGVRNVLGGVLGADNVHKKCLQKTLCDEFAPAIVEVSERYDPVKRSMVRIPRVIKQRGRLRWIGDLVSRGVGKVASRLGVNPWGFKRRQGGEATLAARAVEFIVANWQKIPVQQIFQ